MKVKLNQIATKARQDKKLKFTSLIHHVNEANLAECYQTFGPMAIQEALALQLKIAATKIVQPYKINSILR